MTDYKTLDELVRTVNLSEDELHITYELEKEIQKQNLRNIETKSIIDKIEIYFGKNKMLIHLAEKAINDNEIEFAESLINELPNTEDYTFFCRYVGQRFLLKHYAKSTELENFLNCLKECKPSKFPMNNVSESKALMIENYSQKNGFEEGLNLCKNKAFGDKYCMATIRWTAHSLSLDDINTILSKFIVFTKIEPNAKAILYVLHFSNQQKPVSIADDEFRLVLNEVALIDKKIRFGDGRLSDSLFCDLASSTHDINQINECKRKIIDPFYKKELNYYLKNIEVK